MIDNDNTLAHNFRAIFRLADKEREKALATLIECYPLQVAMLPEYADSIDLRLSDTSTTEKIVFSGYCLDTWMRDPWRDPISEYTFDVSVTFDCDDWPEVRTVADSYASTTHTLAAQMEQWLLLDVPPLP